MTTTAGQARAGTAAGAPVGGAGGSGRAAGAPGWRRWRGPAMLVAFVLLGGVVIALIQRGPAVAGPLDPADTGPRGAHALAALLEHRGQAVIRAGSAAAAATQARPPGTTLVITSPGRLSRGQLAGLALVPADLLIVAPDGTALTALAPGVTLAGPAPVLTTPPRCGLPGARLAGTAYAGGQAFRTSRRGAWRCYPASPLAPQVAGGFAALIRYGAGGRTVTVLGSGSFLANQRLGSDGNAALALNLLAATPRIVWLVPAPPAAAPARPRSPAALVPPPAYLVAAELAVALLLAALWRARRFGPLVAEPLPVVVRASETVEGHGRLYRARRARGRAAAALRAATLARITTRLGLPRAVPADVICRELAARTGREPGEVQAILFGPAPRDDAALVSLAAGLDQLEGQVLTT